MGANISNVMSSSQLMLSPHLNRSSPVMTFGGPDLMDPNILDLLSSMDTDFLEPNLFPPRDLTSSSQLFEMSNMDDMLPYASNSGYPMQQIPTVPLHWKATDDSRGINMERRMEPNLHAPANALSPWPESFDAGNNGSLQQASHQGWQLVGAGLGNKSLLQASHQGWQLTGDGSGNNRSLQQASHQGWQLTGDGSGHNRFLQQASYQGWQLTGDGSGNNRSLQQTSHQGWQLTGAGSGNNISLQQASHEGWQLTGAGSGNNRTLQPASHQGWQLAGAGSGNNRSLQQASHQGWQLTGADSGNNRSLQQASHQGWQLAGAGSGNNRSLQQASHRGWQLAEAGAVTPVIGHQVVLPRVIVPTQKEEEQMNQLGLQSTKKRGRKRKTTLSSLVAGGKADIDSYLGKGVASQIGANNSISALRKSVDAITQAEWKAFEEIGMLHATKGALLSCHFHSHGKLLAAAGHERKVVIWDLETGGIKIGEGHVDVITDIRFRPNSTMFATSSFDRSVMIWNAAEPSNPFKRLVGHAGRVLSIDFHPTKDELLSSCDSNDEIRLWDVNTGSWKYILRGGSRQVRFQPRFGNLLASCTGHIINIFDVETNRVLKQLLGHVTDIRSICWDMSGMFLGSVSEDSARIWCVTSGTCLHEVQSGGNKFQSCTFHPGRGQFLLIGSHESIEAWNPIFQNHTTRSYQVCDGVVTSLENSPENGLIASVGHDQVIKIWK